MRGSFLQDFARLDGLFVHSRYNKRYIFSVVRYVKERQEGERRELVLECPIYKLEAKQELIGGNEDGFEMIEMNESIVPAHDDHTVESIADTGTSTSGIIGRSVETTTVGHKVEPRK